jgi:succinate dehydrogenase hydrophobic anchor subunit
MAWAHSNEGTGTSLSYATLESDVDKVSWLEKNQRKMLKLSVFKLLNYLVSDLSPSKNAPLTALSQHGSHMFLMSRAVGLHTTLAVIVTLFLSTCQYPIYPNIWKTLKEFSKSRTVNGRLIVHIHLRIWIKNWHVLVCVQVTISPTEEMNNWVGASVNCLGYWLRNVKLKVHKTY